MTGLPQDLVEPFKRVEEQVVWLHGHWRLYRQLYGTNPERIELLNETASTFFGVVGPLLYDTVQLTLAKLCDPPATSGQKNLSLEALLEIIDKSGETELSTNLKKQLQVLRESCRRFRTRRNKKLAHFDRETLLTESRLLPGVSRSDIETALEHLREFMHLIEQRYLDTEVAYEEFILRDDGEALIASLVQARRYEELVQAREIDFHDWERSRHYRALVPS